MDGFAWVTKRVCTGGTISFGSEAGIGFVVGYYQEGSLLGI